MSKRDDAEKLLDKYLPEGRVIRSTDGQAFIDLTGKTQAQLVAAWKTKEGRIMTTCNGFVGWFAGNLKITGIESWFRLEESLRAIGKGHAWVPADGSSDPQYGDILHHTKGGTGLHVDVCIGFTADRKLKRAASGQTLFKSPRDPDHEFDVIKRVTGDSKYNFRNLIGWLDIEQFFWAPPSANVEPTGKWAAGWWKVNDGTQYYYYLDVNGTMQYTETPPASPYAPAPRPLNTGRYEYEPGRRIVMTWKEAGGAQTIETFDADIDLKTMAGSSNRFAPLKAVRYTQPPWKG